MLRFYALLFASLTVATNIKAQWTPVTSLYGSNATDIISNGADLVITLYDDASPGPYYYSTDSGLNWTFYYNSATMVPYLWDGNRIYSDSAGNVLIDYNFTGQGNLKSTYFASHGLMPYYYAYSNGRFFAYVPNDSTTHLYYSDDTLATWNLVTQIWDATVRMPGNMVASGNGWVYAANDSTIFRSLDNGNTWDSLAVLAVMGSLVARDSTMAFMQGPSFLDYSEDGGNHFKYVDLPNNIIWSNNVTIGDSGIYVAYLYGLCSVNTHTQALTTIDISQLPDSNIYSICYYKGSILIATMAGVYQYNEITKFFAPFDISLNEFPCGNISLSNQCILTTTNNGLGTYYLGVKNVFEYSPDRGFTFKNIFINNANIYCPMLIDTQAYFFSSKDVYNDTDYIQPYEWLYKIVNNQPVTVYTDTIIKMPQAMFQAGASLFLYDAGKKSVLISKDTGQTWQQTDTLSREQAWAVFADSVYIASGQQILAYDSNGKRAYAINIPWLNINISGIRSLLVNDTSFIFDSYAAIYQVPKSNTSTYTTLGTISGNFDTTYITQITTANGYLIACTGAGVFVKAPDSTNWQLFEQGLKGCPLNYVYVGDSLLYGTLPWLWARKLSDLGNNTTTNVSQVNPLQLSIYPNPTSSEINISTAGNNNGAIGVYDSRGRLVLRSITGNSIASLNVSKFEDGSYFVVMYNHNAVVGTGKFVVQK